MELVLDEAGGAAEEEMEVAEGGGLERHSGGGGHCRGLSQNCCNQQTVRASVVEVISVNGANEAD